MGFVVVGYSGSPEKKDLAFKLGAHHYISSKDDVSGKPSKRVELGNTDWHRITDR